MLNRRQLAVVMLLLLAALFVSLFLILSTAEAKRKHPERWYQQRWCAQHGGQVEYVLPDKTRVDCLLPDYAVEFDFADKWAESIGQALHYARMTNRKPAVVLILEKPYHHEKVFLVDAINRHFKLGMMVWTIVNSSREK